MKTYPVEINVNGEWQKAEVTARDTLLDILRDRFGGFEVKNGCAQGDCGACTVMLDNKAVNACLTLALQANGKNVTTLPSITSLSIFMEKKRGKKKARDVRPYFG